MLFFVRFSNFSRRNNTLHKQKNILKKINLKIQSILFAYSNKNVPLHPVNNAAIAQLVEQRIRNA